MWHLKFKSVVNKYKMQVVSHMSHISNARSHTLLWASALNRTGSEQSHQLRDVLQDSTHLEHEVVR